MSDNEIRHQSSDAGIRFLVAAAALVVVVAGLRAAAQVILPFLVAVFLAVVSVPLMGWLQRRRVGSGGRLTGRSIRYACPFKLLRPA